MNYDFDNLARAIASGISRREALKRIGAGLTGLLLTTTGIRKAHAALLCGTCQTCDLDTSSCGLPCNPASAGEILCSMASVDGSYLRLAQYLNAQGFAKVGASEIVLIQKGGQLIGSGLGSAFTSSSAPALTASILYALSTTGEMFVMALVSNGGSVMYALTVDFNGRVILTVANQSNPSPSNSSIPAAQFTAHGLVRSLHSRMQTYSVTPEVTTNPGLCDTLFDYLCGNVGGGLVCGIIGAAVCFVITENPLIAAACGVTAGIICGFASTAVCNYEKDIQCKCGFNATTCNGACCGACMQCLTGPGSPEGVCSPDTTCLGSGKGPCCGPNSQCCQVNETCVNGVCTSDPSCDGAFCGSYIDCNAGADCQCYTITEGGGQCGYNSYCDEIPTCSSSADCGEGYVCAIGSCCEIPVCLPICTPSLVASRRANPRSEGAGRRMSAHR